jgi:hypothetical protein
MRCAKQVLLWLGMGALTITPCALGRSVTGDAAFRSAVQADFTFHRNVDRMNSFLFTGESVFTADSRLGGDFVHAGRFSLPIEGVVRNGHAVMPERLVHTSGSNLTGGNHTPPPTTNQNTNQNFVFNGPGGNNTPPPTTNQNTNQNFVFNGPPAPSGNEQDGVVSVAVPEGGTAASYLVPAGLVMFAGIFLTGLRRQRIPGPVNS